MPYPEIRCDRYVFIFEYPQDNDILGVALVDTADPDTESSAVMVGERASLRDARCESREDFRRLRRFARRVAKKEGDLPIIVSWECPHCGEGIGDDYYMVHDEVWLGAQVPIDAQLHLRCLEERIGRPLTIEDFTEAPVNKLIHFGYGLAPKPS